MDGAHDSSKVYELLEQKEYRKRWIVEAAYSTFKRGFREFCMAKTMKKHHKGTRGKSVHLQHAHK